MKFIVATLLLVAYVQARVITRHPMISMVDFRRGLDTRIISGKDANKGMFPWHTALLISSADADYLCGGSLLSENWLLTAAHCTVGATEVEIQLGGVNLYDDMEYIETSVNYINHENYDDKLDHNDVALVLLPKPATLTANVQIIKLATNNYPDVTGLMVTISGYGETNDGESSQNLKYVEMKVVSNKDCKKKFGSIIDSNICAVGNPDHSPCSGDSGGPLVHYNPGPTVVGVASFVNAKGCALGTPSVYARASSYVAWVRKTAGI